MTNEFFFFIHVLFVMGFVLAALRLGKGALQTLIALQAVLANFFVIKQIDLFGFSVTCSDVFSIGAIMGLNLLQQYWGRDAANQAIGISFLSLIFFTAMSQFHLFYVPIPTDATHGAFVSIFSQTPRIALASIAVYYFVQKFDVRLFGWLNNALKGNYLPLRMGISLTISQFLDTILFSLLGLYGIVADLFDIILISFLVKCIIIGCSSSIAIFSKRFVKNV